MLYSEINTICSESLTNRRNIFYGQNVKVLKVESSPKPNEKRVLFIKYTL